MECRAQDSAGNGLFGLFLVKDTSQSGSNGDGLVIIIVRNG